MDIQLPDLTGKEKDTLFIIGNGFDLFHGLQTRFIHFYSWLILKGGEHERFVYDMEKLFPKASAHGNLLWTDFEKTLGEFDIDHVHRLYWGEDLNGNEYAPERASQEVHKIISKIPVYLREWLNEIKISHLSQKIKLPKESLYLTFNYTLVLEEIYGIPSSQIVHIHSSLNDSQNLITGHREHLPEDYGEIGDANKEFSYQYLARESNSLMKRVEEIIKQHHDFYNSLDHIKNVIIFGHSLSMIDRYYFTEIIHHVHDDTKWCFVCYGENDRRNYEQLVYMYNNCFDIQMGGEKYTKNMRPENCSYIYFK